MTTLLSFKTYRWRRRLLAAGVAAVLVVAGCKPGANQPALRPALETPAPTQTAPPPAPAASPSARPSATVTPTSAPAPTETPAGPRLCSPLASALLAQLNEMVSNPYNPPPPGSDDPHQAVDLAVKLPGSQVAVSGESVQAALGGRVAGIIQNRFPYGNALVIETALDDYPAEWWAPALVPTLAPTLPVRSALTCPANPARVIREGAARSVYVLYAHLQQPPELGLGEQVACGQKIGAVGDTGNALNPHLHFEVRVGPGGMDLGSMAHYDASASLEEMSTYCLWRISGLFQLVDPNLLLQLEP